jgi:hypothetical protein
MGIVTFEGVVEAGKIRLLNNKSLPERARVYVLIPEYSEEENNDELEAAVYPVTIPANPRVVSPRLTKRADTDPAHFRLQRVEEADARV